MASDLTSSKEDALEEENTVLRELLAQAGIDAARLLAQAGIDATQQRASERLQRLLLEELHHRMKNTVATVMAIASQTFFVVMCGGGSSRPALFANSTRP